MKKLLPYQRTAYAAILAAVAIRAAALLVMATGLGKTVVAAAFARWWLKNKKTPILFLVHLDDAIKQADKEFREALGPNVRFQYLNEDETLDPTATVVFCTFQTMHNRRRKIRRDAFGLLIVDEGHRSMAATYKPTIEHFKAEFRFAMTATPNRMDGLDIRDLFGEPVFDFPLAKALAKGALTDVDYQVLLSDVSQEALTDALKRIKSGDRQVTRSQIDHTVFLAEKLEATVERIRKAQETRRKTILFCQNKRHARALAGFFPDAKLYVSGIPKRELKEHLPAFRAGQVDTLITVDKLNEAVDVPDVDHLVFLRQTGSARIWLQQLGRGLRKSPGKTDVLVQDFVANCDRLYEVAKLVEDVGSHVNRKGPTHTGSGIHTTGLDFTFSKEARDLLEILGKMEEAFYPTLEEFKVGVLAKGIRTQNEFEQKLHEDPRLPSNPNTYYPDWKGWGWIFRGVVWQKKDFYQTLEEFKTAVLARGIKSGEEYGREWKKDPQFHSSPSEFYSNWKGWPWVFGRAWRTDFYPTLKEFKTAVLSKGIETREEYQEKRLKDRRFPPRPDHFYLDWKGWPWVFGRDKECYSTLEEFRAAVLAQGIRTSGEFRKKHHGDPRLPGYPEAFYPDWKGWGCVFGREKNFYPTLEEFKLAVLTKGFKGPIQFKKEHCQDPRLPSHPDYFYSDWKGWPWVFGRNPGTRAPPSKKQ